MKKIVFFLCVINILFTIFPTYNILIQAETTNEIMWKVTLNCNELAGAYDFVVFGEAPDAHDGPPPDSYDIVKPPTPPVPYVRAWFDDDLPYPYNMLWEDYRHYPDTKKIWNLTILWITSDDFSSTTVTINWSTAETNDSEYTIMNLCTEQGTPLKNMLLSNQYTFSCVPYIPQYFKIICEINNPPLKPEKPSGPISGEPGIEYTYYTTTSDPNNHFIYYKWDWGDGTFSDWLGPYESDKNVECKHNWSKKGNYEIKVKAKDTLDAESPWSDPLPITMSASYNEFASIIAHTSIVMTTQSYLNSLRDSRGLILLIQLLINRFYIIPIFFKTLEIEP